MEANHKPASFALLSERSRFQEGCQSNDGHGEAAPKAMLPPISFHLLLGNSHWMRVMQAAWPNDRKDWVSISEFAFCTHHLIPFCTDGNADPLYAPVNQVSYRLSKYCCYCLSQYKSRFASCCIFNPLVYS